MAIITGIYCIRNTENNKKYVGSSINIEQRFREHRSALNRNIHGNKHLQYAWNKYGEQSFNFSIIEVCQEDMLIIREASWINYYNSFDKKSGYNIRNPDKKTVSEETKRRISKANKGKPSPFKGKHHTQEAKNKLSIAHIGYKPSAEARQHIKDSWVKIKASGNFIPSQLGRKASEETRAKLRDKRKGRKPTLGMKHSEETKNKMRERLIGRICTSEELEKRRATFKIKQENGLYVPPMLGKKHSEETKQKMKEAWNRRRGIII